MQKEKVKQNIKSDALTKQEFSSLQKAEKDLDTDQIFLAVLESVRSKETTVEIKTDQETGLKSALVKQGNEVVFSTQDQGEVEALDLIRKGKNLVFDPPKE